MLLNRKKIEERLSTSKALPSLFIGHGNPMLVLESADSSPFVKQLNDLGELLKKHCQIDAICVISAHWLTRGSFVNINIDQEIIYDFGGFPDEMYQVKYPAIGHPEKAKRLAQLSSDIQVSKEWGLDHGAWTVLKHLFPNADIPSFQLSIDYHNSMQYHIDLASKIKELRLENVLIIGSGNIVHNLRLAMPKLMRNDTEIYGWEKVFDKYFSEKAVEANLDALRDYKDFGENALLSVPTPDHYIPALYALALKEKDDEVMMTYEEIVPGISMRSFIVV